MQHTTNEKNYKQQIKLIFIAAIIIAGFWFASTIISILFLFFFAVVLTLILNAPTMWLVSRKVPRTGAALIVFFLMLVFLFLIGWLVIPKILDQVSSLVTNLPKYLSDLQHQLSSLLQDYPSLQKKISDNSTLQDNLPSATKIITSIGKFSFSLIGGIFLMIVFFSSVAYMLINPAPLIRTYLLLFSVGNRPKAAHALSKTSTMLIGWIWSNLVAGTMEAVAVFFFLTFMGIPSVWVWVGVAMFAELVPKLGLYIMAVPPVLIALSIDPLTALWVLIFYLALSEVMGDFVIPRIRASAMNIHPVSTLFVMLAMAGAFGFVGAFISTPLVAFVKAYYETFYLSSVSKENINEQVDIVLNRKV